MLKRFWIPVLVALAGVAAVADEGMWRLDQLPRDAIAQAYGVRLTDADVQRSSPTHTSRSCTDGDDDAGTYASANGLVLTNSHVALDCIRTSTLADAVKAAARTTYQTEVHPRHHPPRSCPASKTRRGWSARSHDVAQLGSPERRARPGSPGMEAVQRARAQTKRQRPGARLSARRKATATSPATSSTPTQAPRSFLITSRGLQRHPASPLRAGGAASGPSAATRSNYRFPGPSGCCFDPARLRRPGPIARQIRRRAPAVAPSRPLPPRLAGGRQGRRFHDRHRQPGNTDGFRISFSAMSDLTKGNTGRIRDMGAKLQLLAAAPR